MSAIKAFFGDDLNTIATAVISAGIVALCAKAYDRLFSRRPRLVYYQNKPSCVELERNRIWTETLSIQNLGGQEARDVSIIHNWPKEAFKATVQPLLYTEEKTASGKAVIRFATIHRRETCEITYVYLTPPSQDTLVESIRAEDHTAELVRPPAIQRTPVWASWIIWCLAMVGAWLVLYLAIRALIFIWLSLQ